MVYCGYRKEPPWLRVLPRCRVCRFALEDGQEVVIVTVDGYRTAPFAYSTGNFHQDSDLERKISCDLYPDDGDLGRDELAIGCHTDCLAFASKLVPSAKYRSASLRWASSKSKNSFNYSGIDLIDSFYKRNLGLVYGTSSAMPAALASLPSSLSRMFRKTRAVVSEPPSEEQRHSIGTPVSRLFAASVYWYNPTASEESRRFLALRRDLGSRLKRTMDPVGKLPVEIWNLVAGYLVDYYTIAASLALPYRGGSTFSISKDIWATYAYIDGRMYISSLANIPSSNAVRISLRATEHRRDDVLYMVGDHLGIHRITIANSPPRGLESGDLSASQWWWCVPLRYDYDELGFWSDGSKLQGLEEQYKDTLDFRDDSVFGHVLWHRPVEAIDWRGMRYRWINTYYGGPEGLGMHRLVPVTLNSSDCVGYSVCWMRRLDKTAGMAVSSFHEHRAGEGHELYNSTAHPSPDAVWTFIPIKAVRGERVQQVWYRQSPRFSCSIALITNLGRYFVILGSSPARRTFVQPTKDDQLVHDWKLVATPYPTIPDRFWLVYNCSRNDFASGFASFLPDWLQGNSIPPPLSMASRTWEISEPTLLLSSEASLKNVAEVVVCRPSDRGPYRISGLLLRYRNGFETTVGSFRLDYAENSIDVVGSPGLSLGFAVNDGGEYVGDLTVSGACGQELLRWDMFPWDGMITWRFDENQCSISHR